MTTGALSAAVVSGAAVSAAAVVPAAVSEPAPEPPPPPPYTLDRSNIPEEVNVEVTTLSSEAPVRYSQVLDEAERQGSRST